MTICGEPGSGGSGGGGGGPGVGGGAGAGTVGGASPSQKVVLVV